jgi:hypothetical protein
METRQTQINHLVKELAEQLRNIDQTGTVVVNGTRGASKERAEACRLASKAVAQLEKLGINYNTAYYKADELNRGII